MIAGITIYELSNSYLYTVFYRGLWISHQKEPHLYFDLS